MSYTEFNLPIKVPYYEGSKALDGNQFRFVIRWNTYTEKWYMDITSVSDDTLSIKGIALLPGKNLLAPYGYDHILGGLWIEDTSGSDNDPTYAGMGDRWRLRYYPIGG